ncbi:hypothetical protein L9F63_016113, partial [Diploptera punctata]
PDAAPSAFFSEMRKPSPCRPDAAPSAPRTKIPSDHAFRAQDQLSDFFESQQSHSLTNEDDLKVYTFSDSYSSSDEEITTLTTISSQFPSAQQIPKASNSVFGITSNKKHKISK